MQIVKGKCGSIVNVVLYFFLAVFLPDFCAIRTRNIVFVVNFIYILYYGLVHNKISINSSLIKIFIGFIPFILFVFINIGLRIIIDSTNKEAYLSNFWGNCINVFYIVLLVTTIYLMCRNFNLSYDDIINVIIIISIIQLGLVIISYISPNIYEWFTSLTLNFSHDEQVKMATVRYHSLRSYGYAGNLFDSFGYVSSLLISLIFIKGVYENKKTMLFLSLACLIMPALNSRTGLLLSALGFVITLLFFFKLQKLFRYVILVVCGIIVLIILYYKMPEYSRASILLGFGEMIDFFQGNKSVSVLNSILVNDIVYPPNIIFGQAAAPDFFGYGGIDSGYIQLIWRYGLLGTILLFVGFFCMCNHLFKRYQLRRDQKCYIIVFLVFFFVYLFKMFSLFNYGASALSFGLFSALIANAERTNCRKKRSGSFVIS